MTDVKKKAAKARQLLADDTFTEVMAEVREDCVAVFLDAASSSEAREEAHAKVRALQMIEDHLHSAVADEKMFDRKREN